jgi:hypothetical protein
MNFKFSNQAVGAIMLALQKGIMEQIDITNLLKEFEIVNSADGLIIDNPPVLQLNEVEDNKKTTKKVRKKRTTKKRTIAKKTQEDA